MKYLIPTMLIYAALAVIVPIRHIFAADDGSKVNYTYKQYEKFDFEDIQVEGETGAPGDISISPRYSDEFRNKLPYRKTFNDKIKLDIETIR